VAQLLGKNRVAAAGCQIARETKQLDPSLGTRNRRVDQKTGFLEDELDRAVAAWQFSAAGDSSNVVALDTLRSQATLLERERRFRELLDALPAVVYTTDAAGRITYYKQAAADLWGHRPALGSSEWCGSWKLFWPDGTPLPHDECPMAVALREDRAVRGMEAAAERPDGSRVPFIPYPTPIHDETGKLVGAVNMLVDIADRKRAEEQHGLLVRELHHRVKNTLAMVQAITGSPRAPPTTSKISRPHFLVASNHSPRRISFCRMKSVRSVSLTFYAANLMPSMTAAVNASS
jgi:PAS domain S-box-containing protein